MGGIGSGRKAKDKSKATSVSYKPARKKAEPKEKTPKQREFSVPAHVDKVKMASGCRFPG